MSQAVLMMLSKSCKHRSTDNFPFTLEVISHFRFVRNCCFSQEHMVFFVHTKTHPHKQKLDHDICVCRQGNKVTLIKN